MDKKSIIFIGTDIFLILFMYFLGGFIFYLATKDIVNEKNQLPIIVYENKEVPYIPLGNFDITFYNLNKNRTATGFEVQNGHTVACDFSVIPKKSYIYIEGFGVRQCVDTGSAIKNKRLDIYLNKSTDELLKMGIKKDVKVFLIGEK